MEDVTMGETKSYDGIEQNTTRQSNATKGIQQRILDKSYKTRSQMEIKDYSTEDYIDYQEKSLSHMPSKES